MANQSARHSSDNENVVDIELNDMSNNQENVTPGGKTPPPMLVLSRDNMVIDTVRKSAPRGTRVVTAPSLDQAAGQLPALQPGVLLIDTACAPDVGAMVAQLAQHFPDMVVVVAGKSDDSQALMRLTAAGQIYRFLLQPLSQGQTRLTLEAAMNRHMELGQTAQRLASGGDGGAKKNVTMTYAMLGVGLVAVIGLIWFFMGRVAGDKSEETATVTTAQPRDPAAAELALAKKALADGKLVEPAGESALDLYRSALSINPGSQAARDGIRTVADKVLERGEKALLESRLEEAVAAVELTRDIQPDHPRLAFMDEQIKQKRELIKLSQAAEVGNRVSSLLAQVSQRMEADRLITPAGSSARDALNEAKRLDPTDPAVLQANRDLINRVVDSAKQAANDGNLDLAQTLATAARQMGYGGSALTTVDRAMSDARSASAKRAKADSEIAAARKRIADGQLLEPAGDSAKDHIAAARAADSSRSEIAELNAMLSAKLVEQGKTAMNAKQFDQAKQLAAAAREVGGRSQEATVAQLERDIERSRTAAAAASKTASAAAAATPISAPVTTSLKRTRTIAPEYPESARRKGIAGWVEVVFTVTPKGTVEDAEVRSSSPEEVFDDAALRAVRQWRFDPATKDGEPVATRTMIRLKFDPNAG